LSKEGRASIFLIEEISMFQERIFQPSEKMDYNADAKRLEGKKIAVQDRWILENGPFKWQISLNLNNPS
jgi:hypothetical protein